MNNKSYFIYLAIMVISTYLIRAIPFALVKEKIENTFIKSFLSYIPYAVLTAMTIPAIFYAPNSVIAATAGLFVAILLSLKKASLMTVAFVASLTVFVCELFITV
jgi:branched-subunit amino acid transport protein